MLVTARNFPAMSGAALAAEQWEYLQERIPEIGLLLSDYQSKKLFAYYFHGNIQDSGFRPVGSYAFVTKLAAHEDGVVAASGGGLSLEVTESALLEREEALRAL